MADSGNTEKGTPSKQELFLEAKRKVNEIFHSAPDDIEQRLTDRTRKVHKLEKEMQGKGTSLLNFILGRALMGSTPPDGFMETAPMDTPDGEIEKFINELISQ